MLTVQMSSLVAALVLMALGSHTPGWLTAAGPFARGGGHRARAPVQRIEHEPVHPLLPVGRLLRVLLPVTARRLARRAVLRSQLRGGGHRLPRSRHRRRRGARERGRAGAGPHRRDARGRRRVHRDAARAREPADRQLTDAVTHRLPHRTAQPARLPPAIDAEMARAQRAGQPFSLLLADCDHLKQLNDRGGNDAGDEALVAIGRMFQDGRRVDVAARVGGRRVRAAAARDRPARRVSERRAPADAARGDVRRRARAADDQLRRGLLSRRTARPRTSCCAPRATPSTRRRRSGATAACCTAARSRGSSPAGRDFEATRYHAHARDRAEPGRGARHARPGTAQPLADGRALLRAMARELGLGADRVERIRIAGVLHDIGKIGVADSILQKPGRLTAEEFEEMRKHPEIGARILGGSGLDDIRGWVHGPPRAPRRPRLSARARRPTEIPLEARILAVADAYEAMTSDRVYRKAIGAGGGARGADRAAPARSSTPRSWPAFLRALDRKPAASGPVRLTSLRRGSDQHLVDVHAGSADRARTSRCGRCRRPRAPTSGRS